MHKVKIAQHEGERVTYCTTRAAEAAKAELKVWAAGRHVAGVPTGSVNS